MAYLLRKTSQRLLWRGAQVRTNFVLAKIFGKEWEDARIAKVVINSFMLASVLLWFYVVLIHM